MILTEEGYATVSGTPGDYYYLKDHQGNNRVAINQSGTVLQVNHYYPFGGLFGEGVQTVNQRYRYNGKELDRELGLDMYDYGARHYDAALGRWFTVDPLSEKYYFISPYVYVANNPVRFIDPDGIWIDDYFNRNGKYLGKDEFNTDFVRIIDQKSWDQIRAVNENGEESVSHESGVQNSVLHSESNITEEASLSIYEHYNPTDLELSAEINENGSAGATFWANRRNGKITVGIRINMKGNVYHRLSDHSNEIENMFSHEEKHDSDFKILGFDRYKATRRDILELRAIKYQMGHPTFGKTRGKYQNAIIKYGLKNGMVFPSTDLYLKTVQPAIKPIL